MWDNHPTIEEVTGFLRGAEGNIDLPSSRLLLRHLLAECPICREQLRRVRWTHSSFARLISQPLVPQPIGESFPAYSYDTAFKRAEEAMEQFFAPEASSSVPFETLKEEFLAGSPSSRRQMIETEPRFATTQFVDWLIQQSHESRYAEPTEMLEWSRLARILAFNCTQGSAGNEAKLADLQARALRQFANSLRVAGELREAEEIFTLAARKLAAGTGDPLLAALQAEHLASLYTVQRQYTEAIQQTTKAGEIYRRLGESHALARAVIKEAIAAQYSGDPEGAIRRLNLAIPLIDLEEDPHLLLAACHNLVSSYIELDRPKEALSIYLQIKELYRDFSDSLIQLRYSWQEGTLLRDLGQLQEAEQILQHTRACYLEKGLTVEAAEVSLDLTAVYVRLKAFDDLAETVSATAVIFRALGMDRDALASLLQLQQVAHEEQRALELVRSLAAQLETVAKKIPARV